MNNRNILRGPLSNESEVTNQLRPQSSDNTSPINKHLIDVMMHTTQEWEDREGYVPTEDSMAIYTDYRVTSGGIDIPGIKIGDGATPIEDLPFITDWEDEKIEELEDYVRSLFLGETTTALYDGYTSPSIVIDGEVVVAKNGNIAVYNSSEFIWDEANGKWAELGIAVFVPGTGVNSAQQAGTGALAIGDLSFASGGGNTEDSAFKVTGSANATTYTTDIGHGLSVGMVIGFHVGLPSQVIAKVTSVNSGTSFSVDNTLSSIGLNGVKVKIITGVSYGQASHSEGYETVASGDCSHAEGINTEASGEASHAEGINTTASRPYSHAEGLSTEASGVASHAEGSFTKATQDYSHTEGLDTKASGYAAHTEGLSTEASGEASHAEGNSTKATGSDAHVEGYGSYTQSTFTVNGAANATTYTTSAAHNLNEGQVVEYNGIYSKITTVSTSTSFKVDKTLSPVALSNANIYIVKGIAFGENSHAEGSVTTASGKYSHAEGSNNTASGESSHAEGARTKASANHSHAGGFASEVSSLRGFAHGRNVEAKSNVEGQFAVGKYNKSNTNQIASVGIGTGITETERKNAFEIMQNGDAYLYGVGGYNGTNPSDATPINQLIGQGGSSALQITGRWIQTDGEFQCTSGHTLVDVKDALLAGTVVIADVEDVDNSTRYVTSDLSVVYDSGVWYALSHTFCQGVIDNWTTS